MCFSASASFTASGLLACGGVVGLRRAPSARWLLFAAIPLAFALQQLGEGVEWLTFAGHGGAGLRLAGALLFLAFAQILWPIWIPLSLVLPERVPMRRRLLTATAIVGVAVAAWFACCLWRAGVVVQVVGHHLRYESGPRVGLGPVSDCGYALATVLPPFLSGRPRMWLLGVAVAVAYAVTMIAFRETAISVWCFLSAVLSIVVIVVVDRAAPRPRSERVAPG